MELRSLLSSGLAGTKGLKGIKGAAGGPGFPLAAALLQEQVDKSKSCGCKSNHFPF